MCNRVLCDDHSPPHCSRLDVKGLCLTGQGIQSFTHWEEYRCLLKQACVDWNLLDKDPALVTDTNMVLARVEAEMTPHLAAALDPRFKSLPFLLSDHDADMIFSSISAEATSLENKVNCPTHFHLLNTKYILQCILSVANSLLCFVAVTKFILTASTVSLSVHTAFNHTTD